MENTLNWIHTKFSKNPELAKANEIALKTGYNFADTTEVFTTHYTIKKAQIAPGKYRKITGNNQRLLVLWRHHSLRADHCFTVRIRSHLHRTFFTARASQEFWR